jgi:MOSC domain-containing protein YiiM
MGRVLDLALHAQPRAPMQRRPQVEIALDAGVVGDARGRSPGRQVVVVTREGWDAACRELGEVVPWTFRRGNVLVEGLALRGTTGRRLRLGGALLEITGECDPCQNMDRQRQGLRTVLGPEWRGGVTCRVIEPGAVRVGDAAALEEAPAARAELR